MFKENDVHKIVSSLSLHEQVILGILAEEREFFSIDELTKKTGLDVETVEPCLRKMKEQGLINLTG